MTYNQHMTVTLTSYGCQRLFHSLSVASLVWQAIGILPVANSAGILVLRGSLAPWLF